MGGKVEMHRGYSREGSTVLKMSKVERERKRMFSLQEVCAGRNKHGLKEKDA